ncbi:LysR family transcriptional regulator [Dongshaea marina]|uniref:LysR family transcriptional regulator n=1 Tax=Dongshaea marina TaxID=2047966 RepID=UPI0018FFFF96|nr:LysR family transcriptional regulator [Dongshaea marina]
MRFDIEAFRVLDLVIREGSFGKAATALHKAQSAVSYQMKKLEQQLDVPIFDRSSYRARLTPAGRAIWNESKRILRHSKRLEALAKHYTQGWEPTLELVIDESLPMEPVMRALKRLSDQEVPTRIQLKVEALGGVQMRFTLDEADMMLVKDYHPTPYLKALPLPR